MNQLDQSQAPANVLGQQPLADKDIQPSANHSVMSRWYSSNGEYLRAVIGVVIDGYALSDGSELRGVGTYLKRVIGGLSSQPGLSVRVLADPVTRLPAAVELVPSARRTPKRFRELVEWFFHRGLGGSPSPSLHPLRGSVLSSALLPLYIHSP